jgi:alkanesulfonate monooxygenase
VTDTINMLAAVRCGEMQPIMLARTIATLDHMLEGRLTVNIISSDFPGEKADSGYRYQRSREVVEILKQAWTQDEINYAGEVYDFKGLTTDPVRPYQTGGPLLYFGGYSPAALELCGQHCDVYLMWPEPKEQIAERMKAVNQVAEKYDRTLDYGLRVHVIVRDTEAEAREYAEHMVSKLDDELGTLIRERALILPRSGSAIRRGRGSWRTSSAMSSRICGPGSGARGRAAGRRSWARPTRC